jgi:hypothetical protein
MSIAAFYLHKADQCARLELSAEPAERCRYESERKAWMRTLATEIGADVVALEAIIAAESQSLLPAPSSTTAARGTRPHSCGIRRRGS